MLFEISAGERGLSYPGVTKKFDLPFILQHNHFLASLSASAEEIISGSLCPSIVDQGQTPLKIVPRADSSFSPDSGSEKDRGLQNWNII